MTIGISRTSYYGTSLNSPIESKGTLLDAASWTRQAKQVDVSQTTFPGIFWACVIKTTDHITNPINQYYMYISSDHSSGAGGIGLLTGPTPVGPWTWFGVVYTDVFSGTQTETPSIIWDDQNNRYIMFYQQQTVSGANGQQSTLSAISTDGITWTRQAQATFINDVPGATLQHGDGHTGYFFPFRDDTGWMGYSLYGGTTQYDYVIWRPKKGILGSSWETNGVTIGYAQHMMQGTPLNDRDCMVMGMVNSGNEKYAIIRCFDGTATGAAPQNGIVCISKISDDGRHVTSRPVMVWDPSILNESTNLRSVTWYVFHGILYVYFAVNQQSIECISHVL